MHSDAISEALSARSASVDRNVLEAYSAYLEKLPIAVLAVGGFGRRELFPCSDVDLLILTPDDISGLKEPLSVFLQTLWDSGLRPSHSVHTTPECVTEQEQNAELTISLLDRRRLAGDAALYDAFDQKFRAFIHKRAESIARQLAQLATARRAKFQNSIYHLEPNVKDAPGALRDLQIVRWLAALHPRDLAQGLPEAFDFFAQVRIRLHELSGRDQNVLTFEAQDALSGHPSELMRDYYRHAKLVDRAARYAIERSAPEPGSLIGRFHDWRSRLSNSEFSVVRDQVLLRSSNILPADLSLFIFAARHQLRLAPDTVDRLRGFVPRATWDGWRQLLTLPHASFGLRAMQECGVLTVLLPEWKNIEFLVVRDFYHRYTVDEHTLVAIDSLESIADARFSGLLDEIPDRALLRFALLMHDIGKGSGNDHVTESVRIAHLILDRLGAPESDRMNVEFLIRKHLVLSSAIASRDLSEPETARLLAAEVETIERLKMLAMLTYSDISAVNPQAMTPWRLEQLWRAYLAAHDELTRELSTARIHAMPGMDPERAQFLEGLPTRYLRTQSPAEIDGHFALSRQLQSRPVAIEIARERGAFRLTLITRDRPALFAPVAGAIAGFGLNIVKAEAFSNAQGVVVDTFIFSDPHRTLEQNPSETDRLRGVVRKVVEGKQDASKLLRGRPKPLIASRPRLKPRVSFHNETLSTLIEIVAEDRPGLLYDLARTLTEQGCNIEVVLIDTEAHKALDVFYVNKIADADEERLKRVLIAACAAS